MTKAGIPKPFDPRQIFLNMIAMNIFPFAAKPLVVGMPGEANFNVVR